MVNVIAEGLIALSSSNFAEGTTCIFVLGKQSRHLSAKTIVGATIFQKLQTTVRWPVEGCLKQNLCLFPFVGGHPHLQAHECSRAIRKAPRNINSAHNNTPRPGKLPSLHFYYGLISNTTPTFAGPPKAVVP